MVAADTKNTKWVKEDNIKLTAVKKTAAT